MQRDSQTDVALEADAEERGKPAPGSCAADDAEAADEPEFDPEDFEPRPFRPPDRRRVAMVLAVLLVILCAVVVPPLISANRFRGQIAGSIAASIGRPVHMGAVTLDILPWPGFTLENFVVGEDPPVRHRARNLREDGARAAAPAFPVAAAGGVLADHAG